MHNKLRLFLPFLCFVLVGCSLMPNEMKRAERIMNTSPDSALQILQHMQPVQTMSDANRAWYGVLYFEALDKNNKPLQPDSLITFSLKYYQKNGDNSHLGMCYFYKAKVCKLSQRFEDATLLYLKALDLIVDQKQNYFLLGKIYSDMGDICIIQHDYNDALNKFKLSVDCFEKSNNPIEATYRIISIGKVFHFQKNYPKAQSYYKQALYQTKDSLLQGFAFQEMGINYYWAKQYDSAQYFLKKSLLFPYKGTNFAIRYLNLADIFLDREEYDSAYVYASDALKYPSTYFNQRDCYRILSNSEYNRGNLKQMAVYIAKYQDCNDSVRKVEIQTKTTILEDIHETTQAAGKTKQYLVVLAWVIPIILLVGSLIVIRLRKRNKGKEKELEQAEVQISHKQSLLIVSLKQKIVEMRVSQLSTYKKASLAQRELMDKQLYLNCLHINEWDEFKKLMNNTFNNLITVLETTYSELTRKDLIWCCLFLLDVPTPDMALILESQPGSLYKQKQRLIQKLKLKTAKELNQLLTNLSEKI
jgi:tetratricopeptide (TPR) repeat protein